VRACTSSEETSGFVRLARAYAGCSLPVWPLTDGDPNGVLGEAEMQRGFLLQADVIGARPDAFARRVEADEGTLAASERHLNVVSASRTKSSRSFMFGSWSAR
jgi:hypothetical protein